MLKNYLTIAFRNLNKFRFYSLINIFGLALGIAAALVIFLYVQFELSFDRHHANSDRIYRVDWELKFGDNYTYNAAVTPPMAEVLVRDYPEVETAARLQYSGSFYFKPEQENFKEWQVVYADNSLFHIFTIPFIAGDPATALIEPYSMVISESCAARFFPDQDALGKTIIKDNQDAYTVTGVFEDIPENSHFHYQIFLSMNGLDESKNNNWIGGPFNTYLLLRPGADPQELEDKLPTLVENYILPYASSVVGNSFIDQLMEAHNYLKLHLFPLTDIHLHSHLRNELESNSDITYVYLLLAIAIFILMVAIINFMNLTTARSSTRAREVGIRKVMGSGKGKLVSQFLIESTMISLISFILALGLAEFFLNSFNQVIGRSLTIPWGNAWFYLFILLGAMAVGMLSGIYPALVLSRFIPVKVLKGKIMAENHALFMRRGLVIVQFSISIFLIITTLAMYQQMNFISSKKLGFEKEQVILIRDTYHLNDKQPVIRDEICKLSFIKNGTISSFFPGPGTSRNTPLIWRYGQDPTPENSMNAEKWTVDYDYIPAMNMEIIEGRNFSREFASDSNAVILNETAVKQLGLAPDPIGKKVSLFKDHPDGSQDRSRQEHWTIIGVVKDFNFESLRQDVGPLGLFFGTSSRGFMAFRFTTYETDQVISAIQRIWKELATDEPFNYSFLDQDFAKMYTSEKRLERLFILFSGLALAIACLGLFALVSYSTEQRSKEIGVRKVLGASVNQIVLLLSREFSRLILFSFFLAAPLAWYGIYWYFQQYAYKTQISLLVYLGAGLMAFILAGITMFYQSVKAANANPVQTLQSE
ncbi:MAG: ABC transporter permease [Candidatus Cyclobacteriaceae bacterium M3_2C_046]